MSKADELDPHGWDTRIDESPPAFEPFSLEDRPTNAWAKRKPKYRDMTGVVLDGIYQLESKENEGGSGEIWRARDLSHNTEWLVKLLPAEFAEDQLYIDALLREAKVTASLPGGFFPKVVRSGICDGVAFYVMEALSGQDLEELLDEKRGHPVPIQEALQLLEQILEAMSVAHSKGVTHCDIKPSNIFVLTNPGGSAHIRILDFGVAKASRDVCARLPKSLPRGTPGYMPPEQCKARPGEPTMAGDVFSIGLVAYEMILGRNPLGEEYLRRFEEGRELPALDHDTAGKAARVNAAIAEVLSKAVFLDPAQRYPDAGAMLQALRYAREFRPSAISVGTVLNDSYRVLSKLDEGGMGAVYEVEDVQGRIREQLVLKILVAPRGCSGKRLSVLRSRFRQECAALYELRHEAIPHIYENESHLDIPFLVMKRASGETFDKALLKLVAKGGWAAVLDVARQVASALDTAHANEIIHRDIKPANIVVDAETAKAAVLDFGIARMGDTGLTGRDSTLGTPGFCAPEQLLGKCGPSSDQWSLAACFYAVLTGTKPGALPGEVETMGTQELSDLVRDRLLENEAITPIAEQGTVVEIPEAAARAIDKAMSLDAGDRYPSVSAFVEAMGEGSEATRAPKPVVAKALETSKLSKREWPSIPMMVGFLIATVSGVSVMWAGVTGRGLGSTGEQAAPTPAQPAQAVAVPVVTEPAVPDAGNVARDVDVVVYASYEGTRVKGLELFVAGETRASPVALSVPAGELAVLVDDSRYFGEYTCAVEVDAPLCEISLVLSDQQKKRRRAQRRSKARRDADRHTRFLIFFNQDAGTR